MTETSPVASEAALPGDLAEADAQTQVRLHRAAGAAAAARRAARARRRRQRDPVGRRDDGRARGAAARGSRPRTTTRPSRPTAGRTTAGSRPATSSRSHPRGFIRIQDRSKDVIKSGGEWISSVALENALMGHPAIAEAAVIAVPDEKWDERPLAVCVLREGQRGDGRRAARVPRGAVREVVAPGRVRVRRRDPEDGGRQVPEDGAARDVSRPRPPRRRSPRPSRRRPEGRPVSASSAGRSGSSSPTSPSPPARRWFACGRRA